MDCCDNGNPYCVGETNVIYERYVFNNRNQEPLESIESDAASLRALAATCAFGVLNDEPIRDHIVCRGVVAGGQGGHGPLFSKSSDFSEIFMFRRKIFGLLLLANIGGGGEETFFGEKKICLALKCSVI